VVVIGLLGVTGLVLLVVLEWRQRMVLSAEVDRLRCDDGKGGRFQCTLLPAYGADRPIQIPPASLPIWV
jgi:hypothetical protein